MGRPVRTVDAFFEFEGQFAVPRARAEAAYGLAADTVGRYAGRIVIKNIRGARLPDNPSTMTAANLRLGDEPHTALLSGRWMAADRARYGEARTDNLGDTNIIKSSVIAVHAPVAALDPTNLKTTAFLAHELVHTLGVHQHCTRVPCLMNELTSLEDCARPLLSPNPLCDPCAEQVELAGYQALAQEL